MITHDWSIEIINFLLKTSVSINEYKKQSWFKISCSYETINHTNQNPKFNSSQPKKNMGKLTIKLYYMKIYLSSIFFGGKNQEEDEIYIYPCL